MAENSFFLPKEENTWDENKLDCEINIKKFRGGETIQQSLIKIYLDEKLKPKTLLKYL